MLNKNHFLTIHKRLEQVDLSHDRTLLNDIKTLHTTCWDLLNTAKFMQKRKWRLHEMKIGDTFQITRRDLNKVRMAVRNFRYVVPGCKFSVVKDNKQDPFSTYTIRREQ